MGMFAFPEPLRTRRRGVLAVAAAVLTLAAQGALTSAHAAPFRGTAAGAVVAVRDSRFGKILVDGQGRTLYMFDADRAAKSACYHACAKAWPPLTTKGKPQAGTGVSPALLGTTARTDHTTQVTYNHYPLYYFITDKKPGDITGQGVNSFGALWWVLDPKGNKIEAR